MKNQTVIEIAVTFSVAFLALVSFAIVIHPTMAQAIWPFDQMMNSSQGSNSTGNQTGNQSSSATTGQSQNTTLG
jgi:hypothetical protein